jgi:uncharacterized membrane protein
LNYLGILLCWLVYRLVPSVAGRTAHLLLWGLALVGAAFSFYLTFLEPFVIGAVCAWCLALAACMALILLLASRSIGHHARLSSAGRNG